MHTNIGYLKFHVNLISNMPTYTKLKLLTYDTLLPTTIFLSMVA